MSDDLTSATSASSPVAAPPAGIRWRGGVAIVVLTLLAIGGVFVVIGDQQMRVLIPQLLAILGAALLVLWFVFLSGATLRSRLLVAVIALAGLGGLKACTRRVGLTGDFWLDFTWRWEPQATTVATNATQVDLRSTTPHDFPQFLGVHRDCHVPGVRLDGDWTQHAPRLLWKLPIGEGWSGFAVVGPYALTQELRGPNECTLCYEIATGRICWTREGKAGMISAIGGNGPRCTPTIVDGRVYVYSSLGELACLDGSTGKEIWSRDVIADYGGAVVQWGMSSSPLVYGNLVIVVTGGTRSNTLAAYDIQSGSPRWAAGSDLSGYASAGVAKLLGREQILILNNKTITSHDPETGTELWSYSWPGDNSKCSQPVAIGEDRVFISSGYGVGSALFRLTTDPAGKITTETIWRNKNVMKTKFTNVAIQDGYVYGLDDGILSCVALETGQRRWKQGRYGHGQILLVGEHLVVQTEPGEVVLVAADPAKHRELGRVAALSSKTWNTLAVAGKYLLVRNDKEAACFELPLAAAQISGP
ncbi:MAG: PQQ-like beta-propeller repeat protein [Pirellulales bacterium]|nr:PQQ-like beta-propeller repeat protein [Pirellulales bacterium]